MTASGFAPIGSPNRPRTLHVIDTGGPGGAETVFAQLVEAALKRGQNIGAVVPYDGWLAQRLRSVGVEPVIQASKGSFNFALARRLFALVRTRRGDVIHAHLLGSSVYAAMVGLVTRCPVIAVFHGATDLGNAGATAPLKRWLLTRSHVTVVAVSDAVKHSLDAWGIDAGRVVVIINGVDTQAFVPGRTDRLRDELGLGPRVRIVGAVGNLRKAKAYDVFVRAAAEVVRRMPDVHFVAAGQGSAADMQALLRLRRELGVDANVHFLGFRADGAALYQAMDVFVSSAASEGQPLSFLEAMACGVPIAATANEGAERLLRQTGGGLLSPVGDAAALAASILLLLSDRQRAIDVATAGREAVERDFSLTATLENYAALCAAVAAGAR